jgi:hypothetical protein
LLSVEKEASDHGNQLPLINPSTVLKTPTIIMIDECCGICESILMDAAPTFLSLFFSKKIRVCLCSSGVHLLLLLCLDVNQ